MSSNRKGTLMRIALFGNYDDHNFGDDLMAVIFGRFLKTCNVPFSVYKLRSEYAQPYGFSVAHSLEELLEEKDTIVYGGGGFLCGHMQYALRYSSVRDRLIELARRRGIPLYGFSLGGNGTYPEPIWECQKNFLQDVKYLCVRNKQDLGWLGQLHNHPSLEYFPDIVWQTSSCFPRQRTLSKKFRVGIHLHATPLIRRRAIYLLILLAAIARLQKNIDFVLIDIAGKNENMARLKKWFGHGPNIEYYYFNKLADDLDVLSSLDLICSTQMHTGVVCMSYGIPFISLFGHPKTKLMLDNLQLSSLYYEHQDIPRLCSFLMSVTRLRYFTDAFDVPMLDNLQRESRGHLESLKKLVYAGQPL